MADKKLNNVSTLTSSTLASNDYVYVEDVSASNEQKKVTITDLAKVVGGQLPTSDYSAFLTLRSLPGNLTDGTDLNDLVMPGSYHTLSNANAQTLVNAPTGRQGNCRIIVITNTGNGATQYGWQIYMDVNKIWVRSRASGTWKGWTLLLTI